MYSQDLLINWLIIVTIYSEITDLYKTKLLQNLIVFYKKNKKKITENVHLNYANLLLQWSFIQIYNYICSLYTIWHTFIHTFSNKNMFYLFYTDLNTFQKKQIVVYFTANLFCTV